MRQPALVLGAELARAVDATHAEDHRRQVIDAGVVAYVLVRRSLRAAVRGVEVQRPGFRYPIWEIEDIVARGARHDGHLFQTAVDLVRRREDDDRPSPAQPSDLQYVER